MGGNYGYKDNERWECRYCKKSTIHDHISVDLKHCFACSNEHQVCKTCFRDVVGRITGEFPAYVVGLKLCPTGTILLEPIDHFWGRYRWLSNFYPAYVVYEDIDFPTVEHAYQAAKTPDEAERLKIRDYEKPGRAKRAGREIMQRPGWDHPKWEAAKFGIMEALLRQKFRKNSNFANWLLDTGNRPLIEGNNHDDKIWGVVADGTGENHLGKLLMKIRSELRADSISTVA
jgi:N-glycosidase YbiA